MIRRWALGLVITVLVVIIGSGDFASTSSMDVPQSNAGVATVPVQIAIPACPAEDGAQSEVEQAGEDETGKNSQLCAEDDTNANQGEDGGSDASSDEDDNWLEPIITDVHQ